MRRVRLVLPLLVAGILLLNQPTPVPSTSAQTGPTLVSATFFGGAGDQHGLTAKVRGSELYVAGYHALPTIVHGLVVRYDLPAVSPAWSNVRPDYLYFTSLALPGSNVMPVGGAAPPVCGATDGVGGTEGKSALARFDSAGNFLGCGSTNFFVYTGGEGHNDALEVVEGSSTFVYAAGNAENCGFGHNVFVLTKYDAAGNRLNAATEPGLAFNSFNCVGYSDGSGLAEAGGFVYVAGFSGLAGLGEDGGVGTGLARPVLMKYDSGLNRVWKRRPSESAGFFRDVTSLGGDLFAVGNTYTTAGGFSFGPNPVPGSADYLIERYDAAGNRVWRATHGGGGDDVLTDVVAVGGRLFAVGHTRSSGAGGADAVILEIDPATGAALSTTLYGGAQDDLANGAATDGTDLYVVGESRSFASAEGNAAGQSDVMLLRYTLNQASNQPPVAQCRNVTLSAGAACAANASVDDGSFDPDSGDTITVTQSPAGPYSLGATPVTLTVSDNHGASSTCSATVTVVDDTPPSINAASASPSVLWPANHKMSDVAVNYTVTDNCGPASSSLSVTSNEPINGTGDGDTSPDWELLGAHLLRLRAERAGTGGGRTYTITISGADGSGNSSSQAVTVSVPRNKPK